MNHQGKRGGDVAGRISVRTAVFLAFTCTAAAWGFGYIQGRAEVARPSRIDRDHAAVEAPPYHRGVAAYVDAGSFQPPYCDEAGARSGGRCIAVCVGCGEVDPAVLRSLILEHARVLEQRAADLSARSVPFVPAENPGGEHNSPGVERD